MTPRYIPDPARMVGQMHARNEGKGISLVVEDAVLADAPSDRAMKGAPESFDHPHWNYQSRLAFRVYRLLSCLSLEFLLFFRVSV